MVSSPQATIDALVSQVRLHGSSVVSAHGMTRELIGVEALFRIEDVGPAMEQTAEYRAVFQLLVQVRDVLAADEGSRRAVIYVGRQSDVGEELNCIPMAQYLVRGGELHVFCFARSIDLVRKFSDDVSVFAASGRWLAGRIGLNLGELRFYIASAHVYV